MSIEALKLRLIHKIYSLDNFSTLRKIEESIEQNKYENSTLKRLNRPMRKILNLEQIKQEQNWSPSPPKEIFKLMDKMDIEEPLTDLLKMI